MRVVEQHPLDLPHVRVRQPPVVVAHHAQIDDGVAGDAAGEVDVRIDVAERQRARRGEDRLPAVQARIARARDRSPAAAPPVDEDHVIELVDRLEAEDERRIAVLLEDDGREERRLEAVRAAVADDAAEAAQRRASAPARCCRAAGSGSAAPASGVRSRAISRRSRGVNGSAAGVAASALASRATTAFEVGDDLVGRPLVAGVDLHQLAVGVDDRRPQVVRDVARVGHARARSTRRTATRTGRSRRGRRSGTSTASGRRSSVCGVLLEHGGRVGHRIEADADQVHLLQRRVGLRASSESPRSCRSISGQKSASGTSCR